MLSQLFFILVLVALSNAQTFNYFKDLNANGASNTIFGQKALTSVYVTASGDDPDLLKQIKFSNGQNVTSAFALTQRRLIYGSDSVMGWNVNGVITMTTTLTSDELHSLNGAVYCTTTAQAQNKYFYVYDISQSQQVNLDEGDFTIVFLNSRFKDTPAISTNFRNWKQPNTKTVYIYNGLPEDQSEILDNQIFSNPVLVNGKSVFFDSVEDFSVTSNPFYMKVSGREKTLMTFSTSTIYVNVNNMLTKTYTTTGFYMKSSLEFPTKVGITSRRDTTSPGITGANSIATIPTTGEVFVQSSDATYTNTTTFLKSTRINSWSTNTIGTKLYIWSENCIAGQFYIQYYFIKGSAPNPTSSPTTQNPVNPITYQPPNSKTTHRVETSTKSTGTLQFVSLMVLSIVFGVSRS